MAVTLNLPALFDRLHLGTPGRVERVQSLWSGYGEILRVGTPTGSVIVKHVDPPGGAGTAAGHPRGWGSSLSHQRKLRSYAVEGALYQALTHEPAPAARTARCLHQEESPTGFLFVFEDLDGAGFSRRVGSPSEAQVDACLRWLASFHAAFVGRQVSGLWEQGSYWHLATRPDEWKVLPEGRLKSAAALLDNALKSAQHQTVIHGDAKVANFCFPDVDDATPVAGVDFQYAGAGVGVIDLAYFLSSIWYDDECARRAPAAIESYFSHLRAALDAENKASLADSLIEEWRALYPIAWADFVRFLKGWAPDHKKLHPYSEGLLDQALDQLNA